MLRCKIDYWHVEASENKISNFQVTKSHLLHIPLSAPVHFTPSVFHFTRLLVPASSSVVFSPFTHFIFLARQVPVHADDHTPDMAMYRDHGYSTKTCRHGRHSWSLPLSGRITRGDVVRLVMASLTHLRRHIIIIRIAPTAELSAPNKLVPTKARLAESSPFRIGAHCFALRPSPTDDVQLRACNSLASQCCA